MVYVHMIYIYNHIYFISQVGFPEMCLNLNIFEFLLDSLCISISNVIAFPGPSFAISPYPASMRMLPLSHSGTPNATP